MLDFVVLVKTICIKDTINGKKIGKFDFCSTSITYAFLQLDEKIYIIERSKNSML